MLTFYVTATSKADMVSIMLMANYMQILVRLTVARTMDSANLVVVGSVGLLNFFIRELHVA